MGHMQYIWAKKAFIVVSIWEGDDILNEGAEMEKQLFVKAFFVSNVDSVQKKVDLRYQLLKWYALLCNNHAL